MTSKLPAIICELGLILQIDIRAASDCQWTWIDTKLPVRQARLIVLGATVIVLASQNRAVNWNFDCAAHHSAISDFRAGSWKILKDVSVTCENFLILRYLKKSPCPRETDATPPGAYRCTTRNNYIGKCAAVSFPSPWIFLLFFLKF